MAATEPTLVKWLLDNGANPNKLDFRCQEALIYAAANEHFESVKLLVEGGQNMKECRGVIAVMMGEIFRPDIAQYLLDQGVDINILERNVDDEGNERDIPNSYYGTALHRAVEKEDPVRVR